MAKKPTKKPTNKKTTKTTKKPVSKSSAKPAGRPVGKSSAKKRRPVAANASKAPVGKSARRRSSYNVPDRMDEYNDRYYELEAFEEREEDLYETDYYPELRDRDDDNMLNEFSRGDDFYVDESQTRSNTKTKTKTNTKTRNSRDKSKKSPEKKKKAKPERKPMSPAKRKLISILSTTAIITVILVVGVVLSLTVLFKTQAYEVNGNTRYDESAIISACGISKGQNIFLAPKGSAEKRIKKEFPYIEDVDVGFKIPDTIKIDIEEADEGYLMKISDTEYLVVSTKGRILDKTETPQQYDLPKFIGPTLVSGEIGDYVSYEDDAVISIIDSITQTFADNGYQGITEIDATNTADISFTYDNRIKVKLGIPEDISYKIRTAMTIITENLDRNQTVSTEGVLDVSRCNTTKRSYFNEQSIAPTVAETQDPSAPTENPTEAVGEYTWTDEGYSADSGYYGDDGEYVYG